MLMSYKKVTRKKVRKLLQSCCTMREIATAIGCARTSVGDFFAKECNADLLELLNQKMEEVVDIAEEKLKGRVDKDDWEAVKFLLKTKGQSRGYREQPNILIPQGMRIQIESVGYDQKDYIEIGRASCRERV